jgi:hypothetical protein
MSLDVFVVIFLIFAILGIWIEKTPSLESVLLNTFTFVILYHLLITIPSVILNNNKNKYLKIFIYFFVLIVLFLIVIFGIVIPMFLGMQKDKEMYRKFQSEPQEVFHYQKPTEVQCGGDLWNLKEVITPIDSYQIKITKYDCTRGGEYIDGQFYDHMGKLATRENYNYQYSGQIIDSNNNIIVDFIGGDELSIVDTPEGFPFFTLLSSYYAANFSHTYLLYSTSPTFKKIGEIRDPVTDWYANNGKGSEREVDGFYKDSDGNFLIDRLTTEGSEEGVWPPQYFLETFRIDDSGFVSLGIKY